MSTIDLPPVESQDDTIIFGSDLDLKIPKLVPEDHELESLRYELENANSTNDRLQKKLEIAVDYANQQSLQIEQLQKELSEVTELKTYLGQATERNNLLDLKLKKGREVIEDLLEDSKNNAVLKKQFEHVTKTNIALNTELEGSKQEISALQAEISKLQNTNKQLEIALAEEKQHVADRDKELNNQTLSYAALEAEFHSRGNELNVLQAEISQAKETLTQLEIESKQLATTTSEQQQQLIKEKENASVLVNKIQTQEKQLTELNKLPAKLKEREKQVISLDNTLTKERERIKLIEAELKNAQSLTSGLQEKIKQAEQRSSTLEKNISIRDDEIVLLRNKTSEQQNSISKLEAILKQRDNNVASLEQVLNKAKQQVAPLRSNFIAQENRIHALEVLLQDTKKVVAINNDNATTSSNNSTGNKNLKSYGLKKLTRVPDDLKLISGVGEALEKTLHNCGIFYFEQIANFSKQDIKDVNNMLNFKGRIDRDEWVKQARLLMNSGITPPSSNNKHKK